MSRDRDPYERTLDILRRQLRAGMFGEGQPLQIQRLAGALGVSSTPVREALSQLAGEGLIERGASGYVSCRYDPASLGDLYRLDGVYALAAVAPLWRRKSQLPDTPGLAEPAESPADHVTRTETLIRRLGHDMDRVLAAARWNLCDRLAPFRAAEVGVLDDLEGEVRRLDAALTAGGQGAQALVRSYYRRRLKFSAEILHAFRARAYQSNIP